MKNTFYKSNKPLTRWWWFSCRIEKQDIERQLDWLRENNFGGVEVAFVYPLDDCEAGADWLSEEWTELVTHTKIYADQIGLSCDFTLGTLWPYGGSIVPREDASQTFDGLSPQRLHKSWESRQAEPGYILNHLDHNALRRYCNRMNEALAPALKGSPSGIFCDSWEVETERLWTAGLSDKFRAKFGYAIEPFFDTLDENPHTRYDYRKLIAETIIDQFYRPFTEYCQGMGGFSRVQCHGAPTDLVAAYTEADVPESEAILFDPPFSAFAASAAAISGARTVSAETFTCLYGWLPHPGQPPHMKAEKPADLKLLADAMFANGVNLIIWHGMPFNTPGRSNRFYATTHVGPDSGFAEQIPELNRYMARISSLMSVGRTFSDTAVYLPLEDAWMKNRLPDELKRPSAIYHWELQYLRFPEELRGHHPLWLSMGLLKRSIVHDRKLHCGQSVFNQLYIDAEFLDEEALDEILRLGLEELSIILKRRPVRPGFFQETGNDTGNLRVTYQEKLALLLACENVTSKFSTRPVIEGRNLPEFWIRRTDEEARIFFAHPKSRELKYPMEYGQSFCKEIIKLPVTINIFGHVVSWLLRFEPTQSVLLRVDRQGQVEQIETGVEM